MDRRADIEISSKDGNGPNIWIDVTMTSPVAVSAGEGYKKVGCRATAREREKFQKYSKEFMIEDTSRAHMFFFGVETMGAIGFEAKRFCLLLAMISGGFISQKITNIYQRLSVFLQGLRCQHIQATLDLYSRESNGREDEVVRNRVVVPSS